MRPLTTSLAFSAVLLLAACGPADDADSRTRPHADAGPGVYFVNIHDGDTVTAPFRVVFGLTGKGVAPAGVIKADTGHHHLLIDETLEGEELDFAIPSDANHIHFGGGQTEIVLDLAPGAHTLQLNLGDLNHEQFDPPIFSERITITVAAADDPS